MDSRRQFLQAVSLAGVGVAATQFNNPLGVWAGTSRQDEEEIQIDGNFARALQEELDLVQERIKSTQEIRSGDVAVTTTALKLAFNHFESAGLNAKLEEYILDNEIELLDGPSLEKRSQIRDAFRAADVPVPESVLEKFYSVPRVEKEKVIRRIREQGFKKTLESSLPALRLLSENFSIRPRKPGTPFLTSFVFKNVQSVDGCKAVELLQWTLELFIVVTGIVAIFLPPLWIPVAVAGSILLILDLVYWAFC